MELADIDESGALFFDRWLRGPLVPGAQSVGDPSEPFLYRCSLEDFGSALRAAFVPPEVLAHARGLETRPMIDAILAGEGALADFTVTHRFSDDNSGLMRTCLDLPAGRRIVATFATDAADRVQTTCVLCSPRPMNAQGQVAADAVDMLASVIAAAISPLDQSEADVLVGALRAAVRGAAAARDALNAGTPHLLGQARQFVDVILGDSQLAYVTWAFTQISVAEFDGDLNVTIEANQSQPVPDGT